MRFVETSLSGTFVITLELQRDERGFFARTFCRREFEERGLNPVIAQRSLSYNDRKGTLRGLHYQDLSLPETKVVSCRLGAVFDVLVDLRPSSQTFCRWVGVYLSAEKREMLYIPPGVAHGFQTLVEETELDYQMSEEYRSDLARGVRWNDPAFGITWPFEPSVISPRDRMFPDFNTDGRMR